MQDKFIFLGFRRGGSSISFQILQHAMIGSGLSAADIVKDNHQRSIKIGDIPMPELYDALASNDMIGVFRSSPEVLGEISGYNVRPILVVRDPRDCIISWFYARHIHKGGALAESFDETEELGAYLEHPDGFVRVSTELVEYTKRHQGLIIRYEDLVLNPVGFLRQFAGHTGLPFKRESLDFALVKSNFQQIISDPGHHNRSGRPYEAISSLPKPITDRLDHLCADLVEELGYPRTADDVLTSNSDLRMEIDSLKRYMLILADQNSRRIHEIKQLTRRIEDLTNN